MLRHNVPILGDRCHKRCELPCCNAQFYCQQCFGYKALFYISFRCRLVQNEKNLTKETLFLVVKFVRSGKMSSLKAYKPFSVPMETVERCVKCFPFSRGVSKCAFRKHNCSTAEFRYELVQG
jgi:hypothetical protein